LEGQPQNDTTTAVTHIKFDRGLNSDIDTGKKLGVLEYGNELGYAPTPVRVLWW
jgi:hypothetical protein